MERINKSDQFKRYKKKWPQPIPGYYPIVSFLGIRKYLSQDTRPVGLESKPETSG